VRVEGPLRVTKMDGFWGQGEAESPDAPDDFEAFLGELEYVLDAGERGRWRRGE